MPPCFVDEVRLLARHFSGWTAAEIPGRSPVVAVVEDGHAVSVCFCARRSDAAAEAGLETAGVPGTRARSAGGGGVGTGGAGVGPDSALQCVVGERGFAGGCA